MRTAYGVKGKQGVPKLENSPHLHERTTWGKLMGRRGFYKTEGENVRYLMSCKQKNF